MQADRFVDRGNWCKWKINNRHCPRGEYSCNGRTKCAFHSLLKPRQTLLLKYIRLRFSAHGKYSICTFVKPNRLLRWINTRPPRQWHQLANPTRPDSSIFRSVRKKIGIKGLFSPLFHFFPFLSFLFSFDPFSDDPRCNVQILTQPRRWNTW